MTRLSLLLTIMSSVAVNTNGHVLCVLVEVLVLNSFGSIPSSGIVGLYGSSSLNVFKPHETVFHSGYIILNSYQQRTGSQFLYILASTLLFSV